MPLIVLDHIKMHLQNLSTAIITFFVIILAVNSNTAFWMPGVALGNFSRTTDVSAFYKTRLATETGKWCGGYYVFMKICGIKNKIDLG